MAEWKAFDIQVPGKDLFKKVRDVLETLLTYLDIVKAVLETIKAFLIDFGNPIRALVEALLALIKSLIEALARTGLYAYYDFPDPFRDPRLLRNAGGYQAFSLRFKQSLLDAQDFARPQPIAGALKGAYILIVADADGPEKLLALIQILMRFFGQEFFKPQYGPPADAKVLPVGSAGDPLLSVTSIFTDPPTALSVSWSLPSEVPSDDPAFGGIGAQLSQEFFPPKWFIERSDVPLNSEVDADSISDPLAAGYVTKLVDTNARDPRTQQIIQKKVRIKDDYGQPFYKFQNYALVGAGSNTLSFLLGQLGTFRFIDTSVEKDKTYYYRVRAYSGELPFEDEESGFLSYNPAQIQRDMNDGGTHHFVWLAKDTEDRVVMGRPSPILTGRVSTLPADFDILETVRRIFLAAYSLNFHIPIPAPTPILDANGQPILDGSGNPITLPQFDSQGVPIPPLDPVTTIGQGSLASQAGILGGTTWFPITPVSAPTEEITNEVTGEPVLLPWQYKTTRFQAARQAVKYAALFLEVGAGLMESFKAFMQGPFPAGNLGLTVLTANPDLTDLEKLVFAMTKVDLEQSTVGSIATRVFETTATNPGTVDAQTRGLYTLTFNDAGVRKNVLAAVRFLLALNGQGVPPNWVQVALLRDIIPWSGQILYDILAKIQALLDAFQGLIDEIKKFIDLLIRKIEVLEKFIQFLIDILNFIEELSVGFYFLNSGTMGGDVTEWMQTLDTSINPPPSGPGGYTGGIGFAYLAIDVAAFETAFGLLF